MQAISRTQSFQKFMIIGNGLVARTLRTKKWDAKYLFFASGVSNSKDVPKEEYQREIDLVKHTIRANPELTFIYFSTASIYDINAKNSSYVAHKMNVEHLISQETRKYRIARVSNLVGAGANKSTILEFLMNHIKNGQSFTLWDNVERNLIDAEDFLRLLSLQLNEENQKGIIHIFNSRSIAVTDIVSTIEEYLSRQSRHELRSDSSQTENHLNLPCVEVIHSFDNFNEPINYLNALLKKYYSEY